MNSKELYRKRVESFPVERAINAAKWDKHSTWNEIIRQSQDTDGDSIGEE